MFSCDPLQQLQRPNYNNDAVAIQLVRKLWEIIQHHYGNMTIDGVFLDYLFIAAEVGNIECIKIIAEHHPDSLRKVNQKNQTIFHIAVIKRHVGIFNLIYEVGAIKDMLVTYKDKDENNMLHLAAAMELPPSYHNKILGAAFQMQRELLWYKAVEKIVPPMYRELENRHGKTPMSLFTENHEELRIKGEKWIKKAASSYTLVAALITSAAFTATFKLPEGNVVFAISTAITLAFSTAAIVMFLSILTSRYGFEDFLKSLSRRFIFGLFALSVSITCMMIAFTSVFFTTFKINGKLSGVRYFVAIIAGITVLLFLWEELGQIQLGDEYFHPITGGAFLFQNKHVLKKKYSTN